MIPAVEGGPPTRADPLRYRVSVYSEELMGAIEEILRSGLLASTHGKWVRAFERSLSQYLGVNSAVALSSGTAALHVALKSLGVGPGDAVVTTPFTFVATASTILHSNAVPIFVDIDRDTLNMDPTSLEKAIDEDVKAVVVVHLAGMPAEMDDILRIARERGVPVVEDAAQALGGEYRGRKLGSIGDVAALSFYATKNITTGEGGAVATSDESIAERARLISNHGQTDRYEYAVLGYNYRMTELQGAIGYFQLRELEGLNRNREAFAKVLMEELSTMEGDVLELPRPRAHMRHAWHLFQVLLRLEALSKGRDFIVEALRREGIGLIYAAYPKPLYLTGLFRDMVGHGRHCPWSCPFYGRRTAYGRGLCPNAEWAAERVISIPISPMYTAEDAVDVARAIRKVLNYYRR